MTADNRFAKIDQTTGDITESQAISTSAGSSDGSKIISTKPDGTIDESFLEGITLGTNLVTDNFTASGTDISNKQVILSKTPADPLKVELSIYGGIEQLSGIDFLITGNVLSWNSIALELLLDIGSRFSVRYVST